jgi:hypothetical protein
LSEVVLNYEELDINQCPGDRQQNAFGSTSLCDTTTECLPVAYFGLMNGGYECQCMGSFHYPFGKQGPYMGKELGNNQAGYPLCMKSEGLLQYPNWVSKNALEDPLPNVDPNWMPNWDRHVKKRQASDTNSLLEQTFAKKPKAAKRTKRFIDRRNNFEKLRDAIYGDQDSLRRKCNMMPFQDIVRLNEDDERFILNLRLVRWFIGHLEVRFAFMF